MKTRELKTVRWRTVAPLVLLAGPLALGQAVRPESPAAPPVTLVQQAPQPLFDLHDSDIKFSLNSLMRTLRDGAHEGWVLAAYPDPKTKRPLIGAGFSLDVPATEHPQRDPLNPHPFLEPSSAQLWQAAGLEPERLARILTRYDRDLAAWKAKNFRRKLRAHALAPEMTEEEAMRLLRISAIQAIYNARAYCRAFDQLSGPQQMALSQLVFQMGVNLEEFQQFLSTLNGPAGIAPQPGAPPALQDASYWRSVQETLIASQWARLYTRRASSVIAMFDPAYESDPAGAEARVNATLRPAVVHRRRSGRSGSRRGALYAANAPRKTPRHRRKLS